MSCDVELMSLLAILRVATRDERQRTRDFFFFTLIASSP
jgi:hypothetical protein